MRRQHPRWRHWGEEETVTQSFRSCDRCQPLSTLLAPRFRCYQIAHQVLSGPALLLEPRAPPIELSPPRPAPAHPCPSRQQRSRALWASGSPRSWVQHPGADGLAWGDGAQVCRLRAKGCEGVRISRAPANL